MQSKKITSYKMILVLMLCSLTSINLFSQHSVMEVVEVEFTSQVQYGNAYMDVDVWINLSGSGGTYTIPVYWDGENNSGDDVFRARLVATAPGTWNWNIINSTVANSDPAFIGESGSFTATAANVSANDNNRGFIRVASNNRTLEYADGTPFFYTADTSWSALTKVFGYDTANTMTGISFQDYILERKNQGFNGLNVISSFPNDTYTNLWSSATHGQKTGPNGETPFEVNGVVDYTKINPAYWQTVDIKMQHLADQGFVTLFETVRRTEDWPFRSTTEKNAFYNYVRYMWARYGSYNMIFSWVHHDVEGGVYNDWVPLVQHAHNQLSAQLGNRMPYGQPRTAMSYNTSLTNWNVDIPQALDIQNVSNAGRDETMHQWLNNLYDNVTQPALNLEPFYPGWSTSCCDNEINTGLNDATMAQMNMYGSVLSGGLAGHAWGDVWYAGAAQAFGRPNLVPRIFQNDPQVNGLGRVESDHQFGSENMGHLREFILDSNHEYHRLIPAADTNLSFSSANPNDNNILEKRFVHTLSISDDKEFALGFFTADSRSNPNQIPTLKDLLPSTTYRFEWYNVSTGGWSSAGDLPTNGNGQFVQQPSVPNRAQSWAYRIRSLGYIGGIPPSSFTLRINAGSSSSATYLGNNFTADNQIGYTFSGSTLVTEGSSAFTLAQPLKSVRYTKQPQMEYFIPVSDGDYEVILHFAEPFHGVHPGTNPDTRKFNVDVEGTRIETDLNIISEVGANAVYTVTHNASVSDGQLNLTFLKGSGNDPIINAIEVLEIEDGDPPIANAGSDQTITLPINSIQLNGSGNDPDGGAIASYLWTKVSGPSTTLSGTTTSTLTASNLLEGSYTFRLTVTDDEGDTANDDVVVQVNPIVDPNNDFVLRINSGSSSAATYQGNTFIADNENGYTFSGSTLVTEGSSAFTLAQPFKSVRYTKQQQMEYLIPVSNGDFQVILHFAEPFHGVHPGTNPDTRKFNVDVEGTRIETDLNIISEVGANAVYTVNQNASVSDGQLNLTFSKGSGNDPIINAIEVLSIGGSTPIEGLIGHWPLDEQSGTIASDVSGEGYNGTLVNGLNFGSDNTGGQIGSALEFDGSDDRINLQDIDNNLQAGFSVSAWINPQSTSSYTAIAGTHTSQGFMTFVNNGKLAFALRTDSGTRKLKSFGSIVTNQWQHIAVTYDGAVMKWYIDGTEVGSEPHSGQVSDRNNGYIGWSGWSTEYFNGGIDDVKIFDNSLSQSQISDLAMQNPPSMPDDLTGRWPLDEQNGTTASDNSGQGNNGTLINGLNFGTDKIGGQIGGALSFDGSDDRINLPNIDNNLQAGFSISAWINPDNTSSYKAIAGTHTSQGFMTFVNNGKLAFALRTDSGTRKLKSFGTIVANQWQHIVATYDGTSMIWYIDGDEVGSEPHSGQVSDRNNGYIGWSGWSTEYFDGGIDDVRLYESALTSSEVETLFQEGDSGSTNFTANLTLLPIAQESNPLGYVHPNPTSGRFRITGIASGVKEIMVSDFASRVLSTLKTDKEEPELNLSAYPNGIYFVKVSQNGTEQTFKVVKE